jgi:hypothetical protein
MKFIRLLPEFYREVERLFRQQDLKNLLEQLPDLEISGRCNCGDSFCSTFYVKPLRQLNVVEENIIGVKQGKIIDLRAENGMVNIDIDNFDRLTTFEVLFRPDVEQELTKVFMRKRINKR